MRVFVGDSGRKKNHEDRFASVLLRENKIKTETIMICLDREKKCYSSPGFFSKPETTVQPGKNPNKTRILLLFKQSELDFPREK
jgi:hypothetical protein